MPLVLFNIGWMRRYRGLTDHDRMFNGGKWVEKNKKGAEVENFLSKGGFYFGYPGIRNEHRINLRRLGAERGADYVDDVTVIFTATRPEGGRVVVGWYKHARVWRDVQGNECNLYFARARANACTLLNVDDRVFHIPSARKDRWGIGNYNIRYVSQEDEEEQIVQRLREYIEDPCGAQLPRNTGGRRRQPDPERRSRVERAAVACVVAHYSGRGFDCDSVEKDNKGWDLEARRGVVELLIEVKGCSGATGQVELTPNEYSAMTDRRIP